MSKRPSKPPNTIYVVVDEDGMPIAYESQKILFDSTLENGQPIAVYKLESWLVLSIEKSLATPRKGAR